MKITFTPLSMPRSGTLVIGVLEGNKLTPAGQALDKHVGGALTRALSHSRFRGKVGDVLSVLSPPRVHLSRVVLAGLGEPGKLDTLKIQAVGGAVFAHLAKTNEGAAAVAVDAIKDANLAAAIWRRISLMV